MFNKNKKNDNLTRQICLLEVDLQLEINQRKVTMAFLEKKQIQLDEVTKERDNLKAILENNGVFQISTPKFKKLTLNGIDYLQVI